MRNLEKSIDLIATVRQDLRVQWTKATGPEKTAIEKREHALSRALVLLVTELQSQTLIRSTFKWQQRHQERKEAK